MIYVIALDYHCILSLNYLLNGATQLSKSV